MKPHVQHQKQVKPASDKGFALVATIMLMILLVIISLGTLSLSTVSLRNSSNNSAEANAKANARMALMIAIGELQKYAGPDRAITATSEILATTEKPNTTGVWESWDFNPSVAPNYTQEKADRFKRWLVSNADDTATESRDFATSPWSGSAVELVGDGALGTTASAADKVTAGLVPVSNNGKIEGGYAWHVADESVKARVNLYRDPSQNTTLAQKRALLGGQRPDPSVIKQADGSLLSVFPTDIDAAEYTEANASTGKIIDLDQAELLTSARGKIKPLRNDITPYSLGVMTDVRSGGLKQDLSSVFEMGSASANTLPTEFSGKTLYASTHGITGDSDPKWSALAGYYNSFRSLATADTSPTLAVKQSSISNATVPDGFNPAPVIAKVDTIFSLVARPLAGQAGWYSGHARKYHEYTLNLIVTPVVTLHNPYNVSISFQKMEVTFKNLPVAFNYVLNNVSQSVVPNSFESLNNWGGTRGDRAFVMTIADWTDDVASSTGTKGLVTLKPGQTLICGPSVPTKYPAGVIYLNNTSAAGDDTSFDRDTKAQSGAVAYEWENDLMNNIKAKPVFTPGLGFELSGPCIEHYRPNPATRNPATQLPVALPVSTPPTPPDPAHYPGASPGLAFLFLRDINAADKVSQSTVTDQFYLEFKIQRPEWYVDNSTLNMQSPPASFSVTAKLQATASDSLVPYANLQFNYGDQTTLSYPATAKDPKVATANTNLNKIFNDRVYRYPFTGSMTGSQSAAPAGVLYTQQSSYLHPFAIFSVYSRTSNGGVYETGARTKSSSTSPQVNLLKDGRLAGKPYLFHNPSLSNSTLDLSTEKPGVQAYELNFQPFLSKGDFQDYMDVDAASRVPALTGNKTTSGVKSGSYLEIPSGPLQTIADFRRSNALTTSYPPYFVQPVGNSLLHPLMSATKVTQTNTSVSANPLLDHSVLANHALYDRFYFSSFATRGSETPDAVFEKFVNGTAPLASQAFQSYLPAGKTVTTAKADLFTSSKPKDTAYKTAAEYQLIRGPFNVNSTSVQAWKAVLASMNKSEVSTLWAKTAGLESKAAGGVAFPAMSLVNGGSSSAAIESAKIDNSKTNTWNGYREITEPQLETLAAKIVAEVRARGPFLSMSEFVNRQIGPSGPLSLTGALEAAIAKAEINEPLNATSANSFLNQVPIAAINVLDLKLYGYSTIAATTGNPAAGAPGWVSQADLLRILEPSATVRGDTFVIRTYGESRDSNGKVTAKAYAEAVVQRFPDYVDVSDRPSLNAATDPSAKEANKLFGRRFQIVSFRWLSNNEI